MFEFFFLGLRKMEGVNVSDFEKEFGVSPHEFYGETVTHLASENLVNYDNDVVSFTPEGLLIGDAVIEQFVR